MKDLVLDHFTIESGDYDGDRWIQCMECHVEQKVTMIALPDWPTLTEVCTIAEKHWNEEHCD